MANKTDKFSCHIRPYSILTNCWILCFLIEKYRRGVGFVNNPGIYTIKVRAVVVSHNPCAQAEYLQRKWYFPVLKYCTVRTRIIGPTAI